MKQLFHQKVKATNNDIKSPMMGGNDRLRNFYNNYEDSGIVYGNTTNSKYNDSSMTTKSDDLKGKITIIERIKKANRPGPPENSIVLRISSMLTVLVGIYAATSQNEIPVLIGAMSIVLVTLGNLFSHLTRTHPYAVVKILLSIGGIIAFYQFVSTIIAAAQSGSLPSILAPLALLFVWIQVIHSFDVPSRKDLAFSIGGSAGLMSIASAQAISTTFSITIFLWAFISVISLTSLWRSMAENKDSLKLNVYSASFAVLIIFIVVSLIVLLLPAPQPMQTVTLPSSIKTRVAIPNSGSLTQGGSNSTEPAQPGVPGGHVQVGGYVGFSGPLNTDIRASLSNKIVLRVRTSNPGYFLGETFDTFDGRSWTQQSKKTTTLPGPSPFFLPSASSGQPTESFINSTQNTETFYVAVPLPNLIFSSNTPYEVYYPGSPLYIGAGRSIRSGYVMSAGTVYTVLSHNTRKTPQELQQAMPVGTAFTEGLDQTQVKKDLQIPNFYGRVHRLALSIVKNAGAQTTYQIVSALEAWMGSHMHYSTNIPLLPNGADSVNQFLFVTKTGYCEQISTSLVVMLRSLGIPSREAVGYVPGSFNPFTDLWEIREDDAHAWVQVWYGQQGGWQDTDPTAVVPFGNPSPGQVMLNDAKNYVSANKISVGIVLFSIFFLPITFKLRRRRAIKKMQPWELKELMHLEKKFRKFYRRSPQDTLQTYLNSLDIKLQDQLNYQLLSKNLHEIIETIEKSAYDPNFQDDELLRKKISSEINELAKSSR